MQKISLKKNLIYVLVSNVFGSFCMWFLLILLTKMSDTSEPVGIYGIAQAVGLPICMLLTLRLRTAQVTDAKREFEFRDYYTLKLITSFLMILIISAVGFVFYNIEVAFVTACLGLGYAVLNFREVFLAEMQKAERMGVMSVSRVLQSILSVILFSIIYFYTRNIALSILGLAISRGTVLFLYDIPITKKIISEHYGASLVGTSIFAIQLDWGKIWKLVRLTIPLGIVAWLNTLLVSIPRLILDKQSGTGELGYFVALSALMIVGSILVQALGQVVSPRLAKYYVSNIGAYKRLVLKLLTISSLIGVAGVVVSVVAGEHILVFLFKPDYASYTSTLNYLMIAGFGLWVFSSMITSLNAARKFKIQILIYILCVLSCFVSSVLLIPKWGISGACWSLIICHFVGFLISTGFVIFAVKESTEVLE